MKKIVSTLLLLVFFGTSYTISFAHSHDTVATENKSRTEKETVASPSTTSHEEKDKMMEDAHEKSDNKNRNVVSRPTVDPENYEELKSSIDQRITKAIGKLDQAIAKINNNAKLSPVTKNELIQILTAVKNKLVSYQTQLGATTNLQELQTLNQTVRTYLKENKDIIRDTLIQAITVITDEATATSEALKMKVEQLLKVLKVTCPSQKDNIATLESLLQSLSAETEELKEYLKDKNVSEVRSVLHELADISMAIVKTATEIQQACLS